jgi:hypothetical protein
VVGYGPFSLWVIHKEGLCPSSGDINRLMMIMYLLIYLCAGYVRPGHYHDWFYEVTGVNFDWKDEDLVPEPEPEPELETPDMIQIANVY